MGYIAAIAAAIAAGAVLAARRVVRRTKKQLADMTDALADVKNGNGNRRVLSAANELTAPLAYAVNDVVLSYEDRLSAYRRTEETSRQLMTSLSHDVRTPLTTLIGYLDAADRGAVAGKERDDYIATARRKARELKDYLDVLFDWFRLRSDEYALETEAVEVAELTRSVLADWIPLWEARGVSYDIDVPEEPFAVSLDRDGYTRILNNLLQNALTHSRADKMEISLSGTEGHMRLVVSDNGVGIGKEDLMHVFDRLYQCGGESKRGGGLGLSIVRQLTEKMNGTVAAESAPGSGTRFTLTFPLA